MPVWETPRISYLVSRLFRTKRCVPGEEAEDMRASGSGAKQNNQPANRFQPCVYLVEYNTSFLTRLTLGFAYSPETLATSRVLRASALQYGARQIPTLIAPRYQAGYIRRLKN